MEKFHTVAGQRSYYAAGVAGHIGHFGGNCLFAIFYVKQARYSEVGFKQVLGHGLGLYGVRHSVPYYVATANGFLKAFHVHIGS